MNSKVNHISLFFQKTKKKSSKVNDYEVIEFKHFAPMVCFQFSSLCTIDWFNLEVSRMNHIHYTCFLNMLQSKKNTPTNHPTKCAHQFNHKLTQILVCFSYEKKSFSSILNFNSINKMISLWRSAWHHLWYKFPH